MKRAFVILALSLLYLLHFDFWLWHRPEIVLGLPVGLLYHFLYCLVVSLSFAILIRTASSWRRISE